MVAKKSNPLAQIETLKAQKANIEKKITEADRKHVHSLGLIVRQAGMESHNPAFLKGVLKEASKIPKNSERYAELSTLGSKN